MEKLAAMREGGAHLRAIKAELQEYSQVGRTFMEVERLATSLIKKAGGIPNFSLVPGYQYTICINKNEGIVHGIPNGYVIADGDLISIDFGMLWQGWNLDTSISFIAGTSSPELDNFLAVGRKALAKAIGAVRVGGSVYDISHQIEKTISRGGYSPSYQLTGHTIGKQLHESPIIPCIAYKSDRKQIIKEGHALAIEVMYAMGDCDLVLAADGWTYETRDRSLTALFEETVIVTSAGGMEIVT